MRAFVVGIVGTALGVALIASPVAAQDELIITADGTSGSAAGSGSRTNQDGGTIVFGDITSDGQTTIITAAEPAPLPPPPAPAAPAPPPAAAPAADPAPAPSESTESDRAVPTETDRDADNYPDASEADAGLDPDNPDTDADGLADGDEINIYNTDPTVFDTDGDGLGDGEELFATDTDPTDPSDGNVQAERQSAPADSSATRAPSDTGTAAPSSESASGCGAYGDWLTAQTAYEDAGRTEASAALVDSLDPDRDGIACESLMEV